MATLLQRTKRALSETNKTKLRISAWSRRSFLPRGDTVFVSAMPKSGSTWLVTALAETTGHLRYFLGFNHRNEHDLYFPKLIDSYNLNIVCHQHTRVTRSNIELMQRFGIKPIVLTRDLGDIAVSLRDYFEKDTCETPTYNFDPDLLQEPVETQLDCIVDQAMPWFMAFYAGWQKATRSGEIDALFLDYREVMADKPAAIEKALAHYGIQRSNEEIAAALERIEARRMHTRKNVGRSGRGAEMLSAAQIARLHAFAKYYPSVDFSPVLPALKPKG